MGAGHGCLVAGQSLIGVLGTYQGPGQLQGRGRSPPRLGWLAIRVGIIATGCSGCSALRVVGILNMFIIITFFAVIPVS